MSDFERERAGLPDMSPHLSVFWKPLRKLLELGNPVDPVTVVYLDFGSQGRYPVFSVAKTQGNRLILWPPSDTRVAVQPSRGDSYFVHHITLELRDGTSHFTSYDSDGAAVHHSRNWRLRPIGDGNASIWLLLAIQKSHLEAQAGALSVNTAFPTSDGPRREYEIKRFAQSMKHVPLVLPDLRGDSVALAVHVLDSPPVDGTVDPRFFPMGPIWDHWYEDWLDGDRFQAGVSAADLGGKHLLVVATCPPGRLRAGCFIAGPR